MDHSINIYKNVISDELCDELISLHQKYKDTSVVQKTTYGSMENTNCYTFLTTNFPEYDTKIYDVMEGIVARLRLDHEYFPYDVHDSGYELRESYGSTMIHSDSLYDVHNPSVARLLSVIIALTDDYDGGIFNFPKQSYQIKLKRGEAITFPPTPFYPHEVSSPENGKRYTICTWILVDRPKYNEALK